MKLVSIYQCVRELCSIKGSDEMDALENEIVGIHSVCLVEIIRFTHNIGCIRLHLKHTHTQSLSALLFTYDFKVHVCARLI